MDIISLCPVTMNKVITTSHAGQNVYIYNVQSILNLAQPTQSETMCLQPTKIYRDSGHI